MSATSTAEPTEIVRAARRDRRRRVRRIRGLLALAFVGMFFVGVLLGSYTVTFPDFVRILSGTEIPQASFIVLEDKLPKIVIGSLIGLSLGISGAIFQTMLRNPLASPDIIGVTAGASASAVFAIVVLGVAGTSISVIAFGGTCAVALLIHVLARRGRAAGQRLILIGIGIAAMLQATTTFLLTRSDIHIAAQALLWVTGSLNDSSWDRALPLVISVLVLLPVVALLARGLAGLELGDDAAAGVGVAVECTRFGLLLVAVALAAVATAAAGPVAFVAFMAGPIARRLVDGQNSLTVAGLVGALIVLGAHYVAQNLFEATSLPVGVVTGALGAPFLLYLLVVTNRGGRGG